MIETFATRWDHWLVAKLFSGMGVGMLQSTLPLYLSEISPTQLRGFLINAYSLYVFFFSPLPGTRLSVTDIWSLSAGSWWASSSPRLPSTV
jgi:MFS family permease